MIPCKNKTMERRDLLNNDWCGMITWILWKYKEFRTQLIQETMALPDDKFTCGNDLCTKITEYCDDPLGTKDVDFMICKPCQYSTDQCEAGDFAPQCAKYCFDLYDQSKSSSAWLCEIHLYILAAFIGLFAFYILITFIFCQLNLRGQKVLSWLKKPFIYLKNCNRKKLDIPTNGDEMKEMLSIGIMIDKENPDAEDDDDTDEQSTFQKTVSADTVNQTAKQTVEQTAQNNRDSPNPVVVNEVDGAREAATHLQVPDRSPQENSPIQTLHTKLNGIQNASNDKPQPAFM